MVSKFLGSFFVLGVLFLVERVWIVCCKGLDICSLYCLNVGFLIERVGRFVVFGF